MAEVCLWSSLNTEAAERITIADYIAKMPAGQDEIYYITGPSRTVVERSPHVEALRKRKLDVLLFIDPIDEWVVQSLSEYSGKKLRAIQKVTSRLPRLREEQAEADKQTPEQQTELQGLLAHLRVRFQERIKEVRLSSRLTDSASVLVAEEEIWARIWNSFCSARVAKSKSKTDSGTESAEPIVEKLAHLLAVRPGSEEINTYSDLLLELAYLAQVRSPNRVHFCRR